MKEFITKYITSLISILIFVTIILLILFGYDDESIFLTIIAFAIWFIKYLLERNYKKFYKKIDQQNQILLQRVKGGIGFQKYVLENMYDVTNKLWEQSLWIAYNWHSLWPGYDEDKEKRETFKNKFDEYKWALQVNSINIPSQVYQEFNNIIKGVIKYEIGREQRDGAWGEPTNKDKRKGRADMTAGSKMVADAISELFNSIRKEFGMDNLPSDLLDIKQLEDID